MLVRPDRLSGCLQQNDVMHAAVVLLHRVVMKKNSKSSRLLLGGAILHLMFDDAQPGAATIQ